MISGMRYSFWKAGNEKYTEDDRLAVSGSPNNAVPVIGYVCCDAPHSWIIEGDKSGRHFKTAEDAAAALLAEES